ncbi:MAG: circumsporozoite protein-membrane associated protein, partial [Planctomycetota bacterium]
GDPQSGDPQSGDPQSGDPQSGDPQSGDPQSGDPQSGDPQSGDPQSGDPQSSESPSSNPSESQPNERQSETGDPASEQRQPSDSESSSSADPRDSQSQPSGDMSGQPRNSGASSNSTPRGATGEGSDSAAAGQEGESTPSDPPAEPNLAYTKKATDMVLDYLQETRDEPDRKLLEELQWDEDDLRRFSDRWQRMRELGQQPGANQPNRDLEEALRSLGMRPENTTRQTARDSADALRGIRDSGNRKPPPAAFRDAFDAFRRSLTP